MDLIKGSHTLETAGKYSLGLIDFETAVYLKKDEIEQPLLGGTPFYATPSHVFKNDVLCYFFKNISRNYYFQDWYAAIGMIYLVVTGERLFEETAKRLTEIVKKLQQSSENKHTLIDNFKKYNGFFWKSATKEFKVKTGANKFKLQSVKIVIYENEPPDEVNIRTGDILEIELEFSVPQTGYHVVIDDPIPAGLEAIDASLKTTGSRYDSPLQRRRTRGYDDAYGYWHNPINHTELRDDRVALFANVARPGKYTYKYLLRATTTGFFLWPAAKISLMYEPEQFGTCAEGFISVKR